MWHHMEGVGVHFALVYLFVIAEYTLTITDEISWVGESWTKEELIKF